MTRTLPQLIVVALAAGVVVAGMTACGSDSELGRVSPTTVTLAASEEVVLDGGAFAIRFVGVEEDSRCPIAPNVDCLWAGNGRVVLELQLGEKPALTSRVNTNPAAGPRSAVFAGRRIELVELNPGAGAEGPIPAAEYEITLELSEISI